ncbi:L-threonine synthase [Frankia casuarinae]|uniref:Threonine synthase n=3 Tax=Frankia TaxID=1854 RepID=Q2J4P9_FRACC|nr:MULTISPECIES: threonine synthase [Frankia]ABD13743.1 L-threonine synthase [Frankia casuarinae]ETA02671.1 L-threonine synthase [Frankia sp. CcI6]EYT93057.1 L-threonine synthase [Frankia casuarinae]KDA44119.1 L-threonine synthase [Frankia sp. BMG5.23]OFB45632.1 threonine synthase [Frankia sp. CgIM4]
MTLAPERATSPTLEVANPAVSLSCRHCGATYPLSPTHVCVECFAPLEIAYDPDLLARVTRESIERGPANLWRYVGLLPAGHDPARRVSLGAGWTPLRPAPRLAAELGMKTLYIKDDSANPTHSFKDRVVSVALTAARELGFTTVACASTGNLAQSVAAHAAGAGLRSVVLVPHDLEAGKTVSTGVYGGTLVAIQGNYDDVNRLCSELAGEYEWAFVNVNVRPFYAEGSKTLGYEVAEQLGWRLPEQVVVPIASGSLLTKIDKAFGELGRLGLVEPTPYRVFGAQAAGCNPVAAAFARGVETVAPVRPATIAKSLSIGNPADGPYALDVARRTGGAITDVTDEEIIDGIRLLARAEGVFGETAGGVTVATLRRLLREGLLDPAAETVLYNTGDGLKTLDPLVETGGPTATIKPSLRAFEAAGLGDD